jgi:S-adenosylmethionine hydrolase
MPGLVTLTTDFGRRDPYAAALEASVLKVAPDTRVVHVSHDVPPGDIVTGAYLLEYASRVFADGTGSSPVHLGVVDPGVGSGRRILAVDCAGFFLVGPDNGLLRRALRGRTVAAVVLRETVEAAPTFQSRDIMAPAAARLAAGEGLASLGDPTEVDIDPPAPELPDHGQVTTTVAHVDGFGTVVADIRCPAAVAVKLLRISGREIQLARTFSDVPSGSLVAYRGSIGYLEVAVRDGSAASELGLNPGDGLAIVVVGGP